MKGGEAKDLWLSLFQIPAYPVTSGKDGPFQECARGHVAYFGCQTDGFPLAGREGGGTELEAVFGFPGQVGTRGGCCQAVFQDQRAKLGLALFPDGFVGAPAVYRTFGHAQEISQFLPGEGDGGEEIFQIIGRYWRIHAAAI